jgi:hypothetical protein
MSPDSVEKLFVVAVTDAPADIINPFAATTLVAGGLSMFCTKRSDPFKVIDPDVENKLVEFEPIELASPRVLPVTLTVDPDMMGADT